MRPCIATAMAGLCGFAMVAAGCASQLNTPHAVLERGEIAGEYAYQGAVAGLDLAQAQGAMSQADHDTAWRKAWHDLQVFRTLYDTGQSTAAALDTLQHDKPVTTTWGTPVDKAILKAAGQIGAH